MRILEMVERGEIDAAEAMRRLKGPAPDAGPQTWYKGAAGAGVSDAASSVYRSASSWKQPEPDPEVAHWKRWWLIPFWIGVAVMALAGLLMLSALQAAGLGFWFFCAGLPFLIGVAIMTLAWGSRRWPWLHVRVNTGQNEWPRRIAISFPIPTRFVAWLLRVAVPRVPALRERLGYTGLDELILALDETGSTQTPFYVDVAEGENGERVQVFIG
jgi:hypothetical protein